MRELYSIPAVIVGGLSFLAIWLYAVLDRGIFIGLLFGWMPAAIGGLVLGAIWPITIIGMIWLVCALSHH